jgi:hypothetical protein
MTKKELEERTKEELDNELKKLRLKLRDGEVTFYFMKKDGSKRKARGTLNKELIPEKHRSDERRKKTSDLVFNYFDLDKGDWRCFVRENFLEIEK